MKRNQSIGQRIAIANALAQIEGQSYQPPHDGGFHANRIAEANASLFDSSHLSEPLTNFAVGFRDDSGLDEMLGFLAPEVPVGRRFEYRAWGATSEFEVDSDDERTIGADFKHIKDHGTVVSAKLANRGLVIDIDEDEIDGDPSWRQRATGRVMRRLKRNAIIRAAALISAAATNTAYTWDATAGKDPDNDINLRLTAGATAAGMRHNRIVYGDTAWGKRWGSLRAQSHAGGFAGSAMTPEQLAAVLAVDEIRVSKSRYYTGSAMAEVIGALVLMFNAQPNLSAEDYSNVKRFVGLIEGGPYRVFEWKVGPKLWHICVEHYELVKITSTLGIQKATIS